MIEVAVVCLIIYWKRGVPAFAPGWDAAERRWREREEKYGRLGLSLRVTVVLLLAAMIYTRLGTDCAYLGGQYAAMAGDPLALDNFKTVGYRILTPLIAWSVGLRGCGITVINLLVAGGLIWAVYDYFRRNARRVSDAPLAAAVMTSLFATLFTVYYAGYTDSTTYLLAFLMYRFRQRRLLFYALFGLALFNRESIVFLVPWLVWLNAREGHTRLPWLVDTIVGFGVAALPYAAFRWWVGQQVEVSYSLSYYFEHLAENPFAVLQYGMETLPPGVFAAFKLLWLVPLLALVQAWKAHDRTMLGSLLLLLVVPALQLFIAADTTRLISLSFPSVLIGLHYLLQTNAMNVRRWIGWLVLGNLFVPNLAVAGAKIDTMHSMIWWAVEGLVGK